MQQSTHSKDSVNHGNYQFPPYIQKQLAQPAPSHPGRHDAWRDLSYQMVGEQISDDLIFDTLRAWIPDADKTDEDLRTCIAGAHARSPLPAAGTSRLERREQPARYTVKPVSINPADIPADLPEVPQPTLRQTLDKFFKPGGVVCLGYKKGFRDDGTPIWQHVMAPFQKLMEHTEDPSWFVENSSVKEHGGFFVPNPFKTDENRKTENVAEFRYVMFESDKISKQEQLAIYRASNLPIASVTDSGGDSLHALVCVDAADAKQFAERAAMAKAVLGPNFDNTQDAVRFTRLPNVARQEKGSQQKLVSWSIGASDWADWEASVQDDGLPETLDLADFLKIEIKEPRHLLQGFMRVGQVCSLAGAMKTNKSWTLMEMTQAIAHGSRFMVWEANVSKVYYIDTELDKYDFQYRHGVISAQTKLQVDPGDFAFKLLRGTCISIDKLVPAIMREIRGKGYGLICLDSIYSLLGEREENSNEDISHLGRLLLHLAFELNVGVIFSHHFSKGKQDGKRGIEKTSGAGAWGRFVDNGIAIDHHPQDGCYNIEPEYRTFAKRPPFVAQRVNGIWRVREDLKTEAKTTANQVASLTDILRVLAGEEMATGEWKERCVTNLSIKPRTFDDRKKNAKSFIDEKKVGKTLMCKLASGVVFNEEKGIYELRKAEEPF